MLQSSETLYKNVATTGHTWGGHGHYRAHLGWARPLQGTPGVGTAWFFWIE